MGIFLFINSSEWGNNMTTNRLIKRVVLGISIFLLIIWQQTAAQSPQMPNNPDVPGLLAEIEDLNVQIAVIEALIEFLEDYAPVPKTGQIGCWVSFGNSIDCAGTGQDWIYKEVFPVLPPDLLTI
jgi:hypothetical protein